jgi:hypothetical protein
MEDTNRLYLDEEGKTIFITDFPVGGTGQRGVNHKTIEQLFPSW